ncbi:hypothetical protein VIBNISFn118_950001 [Vibrio nigripulchritudo SFn118]|nr:hypothetical protein VIBNISFn118_950001 [Vibrio nigripulchritudo SFn118]
MLFENGLCFFYQNDHLGTPVRLVDTSGNVVWQASYNPLGQASIDIEEVRNPLRFQGQYFDEESGLHYNLARYYDPYSGRFIQPDPIGLLGGINHYQYAPNPVMWIDPLGMCAKEESSLVPTGTEKTSQIENEVVKELSGGALDSSIDFYAPFKYIGGITKATGDSITSSVEYVLENPMESLEQTAIMLENGAQFVVDSVNYFPDALILEPLSDLTGYQLSVGARARNDKLINDTIDSISSDISEHAKAIDAGDYVKSGEISASYVLAATPLGKGAYDVAKNYRIVPNIPEPGQLNSNPLPIKLENQLGKVSREIESIKKLRLTAPEDRLKQLAWDPDSGKFRDSEAKTAFEIEERFGYFERYQRPTSDSPKGDYISLSGECRGQTFDDFGSEINDGMIRAC